MKLVQKILSHGLLIAFIVAAFFIYMNRMELFPQWFARPAPATDEHSQAKAESPSDSVAQMSRSNGAGDTQNQAPEKPETDVLEQDTTASDPGAFVVEPVNETPPSAPEDNQAQADAKAVQPAVEQQTPASDVSEPVFRSLKETEPVEVAESVGGNEAGSQQIPASDVSEPVFRPLKETEPVEVAESVGGNEAGSQQIPASDVSEPVFRPLKETEPVEVADSVGGNEAGSQQIPASDVSEPVFRPLKETEPVEVAESISRNEAGSQQADVVSAPPEEAASTTEVEVVATTDQVVAGQAAAGQDTAAESDFQGRLEQARAYFWQKDINAALQAYQSLAKSYPERAEVWGELGNLYFNSRKMSEAMDAYAHTIELLIEQGDTARARALMDVMYRTDERRASEFEARLRQTGGGATADGR